MSGNPDGPPPPVPAMPCRANTGAVIVTFHPDSGFEERLERIVCQVGRVVIVDNRSDDVAVDHLRRLSSREQVDLIENDANQGLAAALNQGAAHLAGAEVEWVICFDQDSWALDDMIGVFRSVYEAIDDKRSIGIIGGNYISRTTGIARHSVGAGARYKEATVAITSGSMMPVSTYQSVGRFRDEFFIDHVDHEFCLRARALGSKVFVSGIPTIEHSIGPGLKRWFFFKKVEATNHSPVRRYYMTRNLVVLVKEYWRKEPGWLLTITWVQSIFFLLMLFVERQRLRKLKMIATGLFHGLMNRLGEYGPRQA